MCGDERARRVKVLDVLVTAILPNVPEVSASPCAEIHRPHAAVAAVLHGMLLGGGDGLLPSRASRALAVVVERTPAWAVERPATNARETSRSIFTEVARRAVLDRRVAAGPARRVANIVGAFIVVVAISLARRLRVTAPNQGHRPERANT
jgi:hypothetical protein